MKKNTLKQSVILVLLLIVSSVSFGQTTYSSNPTVGSYTTCPNSEFTAIGCNTGNDAKYRASASTAQLRLKVTSISGNQITFQISKCDNSAFSNGTRFILKEEKTSGESLTKMVCGNNYPNSTGITVTNTITKTISYTYTAQFTTGTKYLMGITIASSNGDRYYTNAIGITAKTVTPASINAMNCFITDASNFNIGESLSGSILLWNPSKSNSWNGTLTFVLRRVTTGVDYNIQSIKSILDPDKTSIIKFNTTLNYPSGVYKLYCKYNNAPNGGVDYINNNNACPSNDNMPTITPTKLITINQPEPILTCSTVDVMPGTPISGQKATFNYEIINKGTGDYTGSLSMTWRNKTLGYYLSTYKDGIPAGKSYTFSAASTPVISDPGEWLLQIEDSNRKVYCSTPVTVVPEVIENHSILINQPTQQSYCPNQSIDVSFTTKGKYNNGNLFNLEFSDKNGSFEKPTILQTTNISSNSITALIPQDVTTGAGYQIRLTSTSPKATSNVSSLFTVNNPATPSAALISTATTICPNESVEFIASLIDGGTDINYNWYLNNEKIDDNSSSYINDHINNNDNVWVEITSTNTCSTTTTVTSNQIVINLSQIETPFLDAVDNTLIASNQYGSIQWFINDQPIPDAISTSYEATETGVYHYSVTVDSCTLLSNTYDINDLAIDEKNRTMFSIYPNPTEGKLNIIHLNNGNNIESISITDIKGKHILTKHISGEKISQFDIQELPSSIYLIKIKTNKGYVIEKIIKK